MLSSLYIGNYRNLKELKLDSVDQINLITGKNNTGKSTILEAIAIYAGKGGFDQMFQLLEGRGENFSRSDKLSAIDANIRSLASMFTDREVDFDRNNPILIGETDSPSDKSLRLRFVKYYDEIRKGEQGEVIRRRYIKADGDDNTFAEYKMGFEVKYGEETFLFPVDQKGLRILPATRFSNIEKFQFIRTGSIDRDVNGNLFDKIALSEKEEYVVNALRIVEPSTERIAFIEEIPGSRTAVIKLRGAKDVLPLKSMGDGLNRILTIILALVNCDNGFLLIDEFENGLHYSVQKQLWEIVFKLSKDLNIQVFATTHSRDCISGFEAVLNDASNTVSGKIIRLDNVDGVISQTEYSPQELKIADEQNIEIR